MAPQILVGMREFSRPWKLITLAIGIAILIVGAQIEQLPDWDIGLSVFMAVATYLTAPWAIRVFIERRWKWTPLAVYVAWMSIDGIYFAWNYHGLGPMVDDFRRANWPASTCLYLLCGFIWLYRGSLKDFAASLRALRRAPLPSQSPPV